MSVLSTARDQRLLSFLEANPETWFPTEALAAQLGINLENGESQKYIIRSRKRLVDAGHSIASSNKGYMLTTDPVVLNRSIAMYKRKITGMQETVMHLKLRLQDSQVKHAAAVIRAATIASINPTV